MRWARRTGREGTPLIDRRRAKILAWACILIAVNQLGFGAIVPIVPIYAEAYGVTDFAVGVTIAVYGFARFVANVPAGRLADERGRRVTLAAGGVVTVVGNLLTAIAPNYELFLGARFVSGFGAAMVLMGGTLVVNDIASVWNRGRLMSIYQGVFVFAVGLGPIPGGLLGEHFGLQIPFFAYAVLAAGVTAIAWFAMPETRGYRDAGPAGSATTSLPSSAPAVPTPAGAGIAWTPFILISSVSFMSFFARTGAVFNVIPLLAEDRMGLTPDRIGLGLGMLSLMGVILAYPSGWLTDRYGRKFVIVPSTVLSGCSLLLFAAADDFSSYLFAAFVWGAAGGIASSSPAAYAADLAPPGRSAWLLSRHRTISDAGYVIGPLLLGGLATLASPTLALWTCAALVATVGIAFWLRAPETLQRRSAADPAGD